MKRIPATVVVLGVASFLTDLSSEMIFPLLPLFLASIGGGALALGLIEGVADATAAFLKILSGRWTDRTRRRKPLVLAGYTLAGAARPLIGLAPTWTVVLGLRFVDRIGKGLRASPRDALIADVVPLDRRGAAFGFHRMMDHGGAVLGPLVAAILLALEGVEVRHVFLLAAVPAAAALAVLIMFVREPTTKADPADPPDEALASVGPSALGRDFRWLMAALFVFTLGNSTDAFLLLRLAEAGVPGTGVALLWSLHHVIKMGSSYAGGALSDLWGRRRMILLGWGFYAVVYVAFALVEAPAGLVAIFLAYGLYFGMVEPTERAWVVDMAPLRLRGTALGYYHGVVGLGALPASLLFGSLWHRFGASAAFVVGGALAALAALLLMRVRPSGSEAVAERLMPVEDVG